MLPRVVHPADVQMQDMYVNGRDWHYVCGVIAIEVINPPCEKGRATSLKDGFRLKMLDRKLSRVTTVANSTPFAMPFSFLALSTTAGVEGMAATCEAFSRDVADLVKQVDRFVGNQTYES